MAAGKCTRKCRSEDGGRGEVREGGKSVGVRGADRRAL